MGQSTYTDRIAEEICARLADGEPLRVICRSEGMPSFKTVYNWMDANASFATRIARARESGEDAIAEDCLDIADNATNDWMETNADNDVGYKFNGEHVQRSKLRIETRLKLLAKWNPKKYGDNQKIDLNVNKLSELSDEQLDNIIAQATERLKQND